MREVKQEILLKRLNPKHPWPSYIKFLESPNSSDARFTSSWELFPQTLNGKFVYVNWSTVRQDLKTLAWLLFLWEIVLVLSLTLLFYRLLWLNIKQREENRAFLEMVLMTLSHNLGNFLAAQRLNIEILKTQCKAPSLGRLERGYKHIEQEFKHILQIIRGMKIDYHQTEKINLKEVVTEVFSLFKTELETKGIEISFASILSCPPLFIKGVKTEVETIVYILIENAVKYANKKITVELKIQNKKAVLVIENDISSQIKKGAGIGLKLAKKLGELNQINLTFEPKDDVFITTATFICLGIANHQTLERKSDPKKDKFLKTNQVK